MNYGRFFTLDVNASQLSFGLAVFNYRGMKNSNTPQENNIRDKYPIYVHFSKEEVTFHLHYIKQKGNSVDGVVEKHSNSLILSLPISSNLGVKDNLTQNIIEIYSSKFPFNNDGNVIYDIAEKSMKNTEENNKGISYSSLEVFSINYNKPLYEDRPPIIGLLRKLFLDFLYDMEHTTVFHNAPNFDIISTCLNENILFRAIRDKAEYYYQRKSASIRNEQSSDYFANTDKDIFAADYYVEAENKWVNTIIMPKSEAVFHAAKGWFKGAEEEMDAVYLSGHITNNPKKGGIEIRSKVFTHRCADFVSKIRYPKCDESELVEYNRSNINTYNNKIVDTGRTALDWYLHKYCFLGLLKIWYGRGHSGLRFIMLILSILLLAALSFSQFSKSISSSDYMYLPIGIIVVLVAIRGVVYFKDRARLGRVGGVNIFMPRLLASIIAAWFTLTIGEDIFKGFFDTIHDYRISATLIFITFLFVFNEIGKINPYISWLKKIRRTMTLISMAFVYSFFSGVLIIHFFGGTYLERSDYINDFYTNNIYTDKPQFTIDSLRCAEYTHNQFYKAILKQDPKLIDSIKNISLHLDSTFDGYESIKKYLNQPWVVKRAGVDSACINVMYGVTIKLLQAFCENNSNSVSDSIKINELHTNMIEGSLLSIRTESVRRYIRSCDSNCDSIGINDLKSLHIKPNFNGDPTDSNWLPLLKSINSHPTYREALEYLVPTAHNENKRFIVKKSIGNIKIYRDMLLQFAFFAMFIGIFLQLIFEEKPVTEPI